MRKIISSLAVSVVLATSSINASSSAEFSPRVDDWIVQSGKIIDSFESEAEKKLAAVTGDFDCQGLSLGMQQKPIINGGLNDLIVELIPGNRKGSYALARKLAKEKMPTTSSVFVAALNSLEKRKYKDARTQSLKLQKVVASNKCADKRSGTSFKGNAEKELKAWLTTDEMVKAQFFRKFKDAKLALKSTVCWNEKYAENKEVEFSEFLFHFDFLTNAGALGIRGTEYYKTSNLLRDHNQYNFAKAARIKNKTLVLAAWMKIDWPDQYSQKHNDQGKLNANLLTSGKIKLGYDQIQLLYIRMVRSMQGSTKAQMSFFNRGFLLMNGQGYFQGPTKKDFRKIYAKMGTLKPSDYASVSCN